MNTLCIFVHDTVTVSDGPVVKILYEKLTIKDSLFFNAKELAGLRDSLRVSIGDRVDDLTDEYLSDFGTSMLRATAVILKAKHALRRSDYDLKGE